MSDEGESTSPGSLHMDDVKMILSYLNLPPSPTLPTPPLTFLAAHIDVLPASLLKLFDEVTSPKQRATIQRIKSRRMIYANRAPLPTELTAQSGRLRWPLLWERMGGSSVPPVSSEVKEEENWVRESFLPGKENSQQVKKLGGFLRGLAEEREMEAVHHARRAERRLDQAGEEFDEESDEEEAAPNGADSREAREDEQDDVRKAFERKLLELFVDGADTISYADIDFEDPPEGDPTADRDALDKYFDEEEANSPSSENPEPQQTEAAEMDRQNGKGGYDY